MNRARRRRKRRRLAVLWRLGRVARSAAFLSGIAGFGCGSDRSDGSFASAGPGVTIRDSAGVDIVENHLPERPPGQFWRLGPDPEFVLGVNEQGPVLLQEPGDSVVRDDLDGRVFEVRGLARLPDGRVALLSQGNHQIFIFEPSGKLSRRIGGRGPGPGEFVGPEHLQYLPPDTLAVWDHWMGPVSYFDTAGTFLGSTRIDLGRTLAALSGGSAESPTTPLADGSFVVRVQRPRPNFSRPGDGTVFRYPPVEFMRLDLRTYVPRSLGTWDGEEVWAVPQRTRNAAPELSDIEHTDLVLDSRIATGGDPGWVYISNADRNEVLQFSLDGTLVRVIRRTTDPVGVTATADAARKERLLSLAESMGQDYLVTMMEALPRRAYYPAIATLAVDSEGNLWAREWSTSETGMPDQWSVFSQEGRWLGVLEGPEDPWLCLENVLPCWFGKDFVLVLRVDDYGREMVAGYRIHKEGY